MAPTHSENERPRCFVVIGFGVKTDLATGRAIDLDATYSELIKPALDAAGIEGFRAIDVNRTGTIDSIMYRWLFEAELVVADISTLNANVLYELGVRHALKPHTTILMAEGLMLKALPFDLSHTIIHAYQLEGEKLSDADKPRFIALLTRLLREAVGDPRQDSPVYDFLPGMDEPEWRDPQDIKAELRASKEEAQRAKESARDPEARKRLPLSALIQVAKHAMGERDLAQAESLYRLAVEQDPNDSFLRRQLASVLVQKSREQTEASEALESLREAEAVLEPAAQPSSTDPQTLRAAGEINRNIYEKTRDGQYLEKAGWQYARAFYIKQDDRPGIEGAKVQAELAIRDKRGGRWHPAARRCFTICADVAALCLKHLDQPGMPLGDRRQSVYISLAQSYIGMGKEAEAKKLILQIGPTSVGGLDWTTFIEANRELYLVGRMQRQINWWPFVALPAAAAALAVAVLLPHYWAPVYWPPDVKVEPIVVPGLKGATGQGGKQGKEERGAPGGPAVGPDVLVGQCPEIPVSPPCPPLPQDCRTIILPLIEVIRENGDQIKPLIRLIPEIHASLSVLNGDPPRPDRCDEKWTTVMEERYKRILAILERDSNACAERTTAILKVMNVLVEQSTRIENKLQVISRASGGPHIQFDALRPGLTPGFTYPLRAGVNPIDEFSLHLTLAESRADVPQLVALDTRRGVSARLEPENANVRGRRESVPYKGFRLGNYCSVLTLNRSPRAESGWMAEIRLLEGCGDSCERGCGVASARTVR